MDKAIGFRAESTKVHWAVVEGTKDNPVLVAHDTASAPVNLKEAKALSWYAERVRLILERYSPCAGMVRSAEPTARGANKEGARLRLRIEGVILVTIDGAGIEASIGALAKISGKLGSKRPKKYLEEGDIRGLDLSNLSANVREAVLVAIAALA